jgi:hypothetical protein
MESMSETVDHLAAVKRAATKLRRAEQAREQAQAGLVAAIEAAERTKQYRVGAIIKASGLPRASFYRLKGSQ